MTPAKNPRTATRANILNRSFNRIHLAYSLHSKLLFSLAYTFLSIIGKPPLQYFSERIKHQNVLLREAWLDIYTSIFPTY
jgi:hypothetical protein